MKKEKLILAAVSLFLVIISLVGVSVAIGAVQNETSVEKNAKESVREKEDEITKKPFRYLSVVWIPMEKKGEAREVI